MQRLGCYGFRMAKFQTSEVDVYSSGSLCIVFMT